MAAVLAAPSRQAVSAGLSNRRQGTLPGRAFLRPAGAFSHAQAPPRRVRPVILDGISCKAETRVGLPPEFKTAIDEFIAQNPVVAFIKGTKDMPMCGFSNTVVQILNATGVPYATVNVLDSEVLRDGMKHYSAWPTFPQIYIAGEFFGGCDIMVEAYTKGELAKALDDAVENAGGAGQE